MSFWEAKAKCLGRGRFIATVLTDEQTHFVQRLMKLRNINPSGTLWLGAAALTNGQTAWSKLVHGRQIVTLTISITEFGQEATVREGHPRSRFPFICKNLEKQSLSYTRIKPLGFENSTKIDELEPRQL